jgi:hypothetical protein
MSKPSLSVPTSFKCRFRFTEAGAVPRWVGTPGGESAFIKDALSLARSDNTMRFLMEMDRKLDVILAYMQRESIEADFPGEGRVLELAHAALAMESGESLEIGRHMEVLLMPEGYPRRLISVLAKVMADMPNKPRSDPARKVYALAYQCFSEEDREAIIAFLFQEDRKRIRNSKKDGNP